MSDWGQTPRDALFLAGLDWEAVPEPARRNPERPVINLIQGLRHLDPQDTRHSFLEYPAIRICVSRAIKRRLDASHQVRGPVFHVHAAIPFDEQASTWAENPSADFDRDVLIVAIKNPNLGRSLAGQLVMQGRTVDVLTSWMDRKEFLSRLRRGKVVVALPLTFEGLYLPALEAMMAGALLVLPRVEAVADYAINESNCLLCDYAVEWIAAAVNRALSMPAADARTMRQSAIDTAKGFSLERERGEYLAILDNLEHIWRRV